MMIPGRSTHVQGMHFSPISGTAPNQLALPVQANCTQTLHLCIALCLLSMITHVFITEQTARDMLACWLACISYFPASPMCRTPSGSFVHGASPPLQTTCHFICMAMGLLLPQRLHLRLCSVATTWLAVHLHSLVAWTLSYHPCQVCRCV